MIGAVVENIIGGYLHPRTSVRRLLDAGHGLDAALTMVALAFLVGEIFVVITPGVRPETAGLSLGGYFLDLVNSLLSFAVFSTLVCYIGRFFRGQGTLRQTGLVVAWYMLVTSLITPFLLPAWVQLHEAAAAAQATPANPVAAPGGAVAIFVACLGVATWLLAAYVAELHRFARTWSVLAMMVGLPMAFGAVAALLVQVGGG